MWKYCGSISKLYFSFLSFNHTFPFLFLFLFSFSFLLIFLHHTCIPIIFNLSFFFFLHFPLHSRTSLPLSFSSTLSRALGALFFFFFFSSLAALRLELSLTHKDRSLVLLPPPHILLPIEAQMSQLCFFFFFVLIWLVLKLWFEFVFWLRLSLEMFERKDQE